MTTVRARVNGSAWEATVEPSDSLLDALRAGGCTSVKAGCGVGVCGACGVVVNDRYVSSCLTFAATVDGADIWTAAGLSERDPAMAAALAAHEGFQCGACTPGQMVAAWAYVHLAGARPDDESIREYLAGNLCRCTGYATIVEAVLDRCGSAAQADATSMQGETP